MDARTYEAILETVTSPIVFVDDQHVIRYLNKAARVRYYEKRGFSDLIGKSVFDCHQPPSNEAIRRLYQRLLEGEGEIFLKLNDDQEKITIVGVRDAAGRLLGYYERIEGTHNTCSRT